MDILKKLWGGARKAFYIIPIALLISISQNLSTRSQLEFSFNGKAGGPVTEDETLYYQYLHEGLIKNRSKEKNTITRMSLVVWGNKKEESVLRYGYGSSRITDNRTGQEIKLPIVIEGREAIDVKVINKFPVKGTADEELLTNVRYIEPGSPITIPAYEYELTFTDVNDNEFDERGKLVNRDLLDMNWTLSNYCGDIHYKFWSCNLQRIKVEIVKISFLIKSLLHWFGMESIGDGLYGFLTNFEK